MSDIGSKDEDLLIFEEFSPHLRRHFKIDSIQFGVQLEQKVAQCLK